MRYLSRILIMALFSLSLQAMAGQHKNLSGTVTTIDGQEKNLGDYKGQVVLVVNVASKCGYTKQYKQLQELHEKYAEKGLAVLAFPCNQFGEQEPGTEAEIKTFCETTFGVTFPMFSKIDVNGENAAPLYQYLTSDRVPIEDQGPITWNFEKFLFNRKGDLVARYRSKVTPDAEEVIAAIEKVLGESVP